MRISSLSDSDLPAIHQTFLESFSDYPLPMEQSVEELRALMELRGVSFAHSFGVYLGGRMVGVWMTAIGDLDEIRSAYTVFTGVIPKHRGCGLGQSLFRAVAASLRDSGVSRVVHEVLIQNERAIGAYRKMGFQIRRDLVCLNLPIVDLLRRGVERGDSVEIGPVGELDPKEIGSLRDWQPTWPSADATIARASAVVQLVARERGELVGYAVFLPPQFAPPKGGGGYVDVPQLAVGRSHRRRGIATDLLRTVAAILPPGAGFRVLNVDASATDDMEFWAAKGADEFARQHEMQWAAGA